MINMFKVIFGKKARQDLQEIFWPQMEWYGNLLLSLKY